MTPVLSRAQMRAFDREAIDTCRVPGLLLMENAGRGAADVACRMLAHSDERPDSIMRGARVQVVCGTGNNGGDGFVLARHLRTRGAAVTVWLVGDEARVKGDARVNMDAWTGIGGAIRGLQGDPDMPIFEKALAEEADLVVDALFGTGLDRPLQGWIEVVIAAFNRAPAPKLAIDLPSGLDADTGCHLGAAVIADATATFGHYKLGLLTPRGAEAAGRVHLVDLGVPGDLVQLVGHAAEIIEPESLTQFWTNRSSTAHKHAAGGVLVMAGSPGKVGAALLVANAALRAGAGLVTIASWPEAIERIESRIVELMTARLDPHLIESSVEQACRGKRVTVVGPGFGTDESARRALLHALGNVDGTKVLDADALTLLVGQLESLREARGPVVLTPHSGEAARLLGISSADVERDRYGTARELASRSQATVVLKGAYSIVATQTSVHVNVTGNPSLATAGAGDVLAGLLAALACSMPLPDAACAAVWAHGCAADLWRYEHGGADRGLFAGELADRAPAVLAALARGESALPI